MEFRPSRDVVASLIVGFGAAILVLGLTGSIVLRDYDTSVGHATDRLDVVGQSLVEDVRRTIHSVELLLISVDGDTGRLAHIQGVPGVVAVGQAADDTSAITWWDRNSTGLPDRVTATLLHESARFPDLPILYQTIGDRILIAHPHSRTGERSWDLALVDMDLAIRDALPDVIETDIAWEHGSVASRLNLAEPSGGVHREYMILRDWVIWQVELRWTDTALAGQGVTPNYLLVAGGILMAGIVGWSAGWWVRRRNLQADLEAARSLLEQKDALLLTISHQLRTPLTGVIGFLRLAIDNPRASLSVRQRRNLCELALAEAETTAEVVEDLLLSTRIDGHELVLVEDEFFVEAVLADAFRRSLREPETATFPPTGDASLVRADPSRLAQLVRNLVSAGREEGASGWDISISSSGSHVVVTLKVDASLDLRTKPIARGLISAGGAMPSIENRVSIATRLAVLMGGSLLVRPGRRGTTLQLTLPSVSLPAAADIGLSVVRS